MCLSSNRQLRELPAGAPDLRSVSRFGDLIFEAENLAHTGVVTLQVFLTPPALRLSRGGRMLSWFCLLRLPAYIGLLATRSEIFDHLLIGAPIIERVSMGDKSTLVPVNLTRRFDRHHLWSTSSGWRQKSCPSARVLPALHDILWSQNTRRCQGC
jgi:hypothetical protein